MVGKVWDLDDLQLGDGGATAHFTLVGVHRMRRRR